MTTTNRYGGGALLATCLGALVAAITGCSTESEPVAASSDALVPQTVPWTQVGTMAGGMAITSCLDGSVYVLRTDHSLWYSTTAADGSWFEVAILPNAIDIGCEATLWVLNNDGSYYRNSGTPMSASFVQVASAPGTIDIAAPTQFQLYGGLMLMRNNGSIWTTVGNNALLGTRPDGRRISGGPNGLYVLTNTGDVFTGYGGDNGWSYVGHMNAGSNLLDVAPNYRAPGRLWALLADGRLFTWTPLPAPSVSATGPVAMLDWSIGERTPLTGDGLAPTYTPDILTVLLNGCTSTPGTAPSASISSYYWVVSSPSSVLFSGTSLGCSQGITFPAPGTYTVSLTVTDAVNRQNTITRYVTPRNFLLVVLGDSIASGEGNPDEDAVSVDTYPYPNNPFPPIWEGGDCHRSKYAGGYQAVRRMEMADPHSSMMFVSAACTGATTANVITDPQNGFPAQVTQVANTICGRGSCTGAADPQIDAIAMNIGANDAGFANIVKDCGAPVTDCVGDDMIVNDHTVITGSMAGRYGQVDAALTQNLKFTRIYVGEYQDPTKGDDGSFCNMILEGAVLHNADWAAPLIGNDGNISPDESSYVYQQIVAPLNAVIDTSSGGGDPRWRPLKGIASQFAQRGYCASAPWIVHYGESWMRQLDQDGTMHPNKDGHQVFANAIASGFSKAVGTPRISGVWQTSTAPQKLGWAIASADFTSHVNGLSAQGWRLQEITGYINNQNQAFYNTVWGKGTATQFVEFGHSYDTQSFIANATNKASQGWRIKNFGIMRQLNAPSSTSGPAGPLVYYALYEKGTTRQWTVSQAPNALVKPTSATTMKAIDCGTDEGRSCMVVYDNSGVQTQTVSDLSAAQLDSTIQVRAASGWAVKSLDSYYHSADATDGASSTDLRHAVIFTKDLQTQQRGAYDQPADTFREQQDVMAGTSNLKAIDLAIF
jgi:hypothetical protein